MYRFLLRPRWLAFHVLVIAAVVLMVNLGFWQLRRLDERRDFNAVVAERIDAPPVPLTDVLADPAFDPDEYEWRQVTATGTYRSDQILLFNRSQGGRAGDDVLTPLVLADGTTVLVNRGFIALGADLPPAPTGEVSVRGRLRPPEVRQRGQLSDTVDGTITEIRRVDLDALAPQLGDGAAPVYVDLIASEPPVTASDPAPVPPPTLTEANHLSYAFQWFIFAVCVLVGWVLAVRRSIAARRRTAAGPVTPAGAAGVPAGSPPSTGGEAATTPVRTTGPSPR